MKTRGIEPITIDKSTELKVKSTPFINLTCVKEAVSQKSTDTYYHIKMQSHWLGLNNKIKWFLLLLFISMGLVERAFPHTLK